MKFVVILGLLCLQESVRGWGGLFNRQSAALLPSQQMSGHYYNYLKESPYNVEEPRVISRPIEERETGPFNEILRRELEEVVADSCYQRKCTSNEHCCDGSICADTKFGVTGACVAVFGNKAGESCYRDSDCESGLLCIEGYSGRQCEEPAAGTGKFGADCQDSSDCNINAGLCCRLQRKQKQQPRKLCSYFTDPNVCLGSVSSGQILKEMEHTAEEKRHSAHPDYAYLKYK